MIKRVYTYLLAILIAVCAASCAEETCDIIYPDGGTFKERLERLPGVVKVTAEDPGTFNERYKVYFRQPIDHDNPSAGSFTQLVYVMLNHADSVNVLVTEGYYAFDAQRVQELVPMFGANQIVVEHRYYGESVVDDPSYRYMNADNSCDDLHAVVSALKQVLGGKWISTGVSKSGLTCNMYRAWYPQDVDVTVPYGTPFCTGRYDTRTADALAHTIGTPEQRGQMLAFMREALMRRDAMAPMFEAAAREAGITLPLPARELWDLHVMDWQAAAWMLSYDLDLMPALDASDKEIFDYIMNLDDASTWDTSYDVNKYYIQAYSELGHMAYCTEGIEDLLVVSDAVLGDYLRYTYLPEGYPDTFSTAMHDKVDAFLRSTDAKYVFIYGGNDPWYYAGVGDEYINGDNICRYVLPGAGHHTAISEFDPATRQQIKHKIEEFLGRRQ